MGALGRSYVESYFPSKKNLLVLDYWTEPYNRSPYSWLIDQSVLVSYKANWCSKDIEDISKSE